jgi:hypothetical protein
VIDPRSLYHYREGHYQYNKDQGEKVAIFNYVWDFLKNIYTEQLSSRMVRKYWLVFLEKPVDESPKHYTALLDIAKEILLSNQEQIRHGFLEFIYRAFIEIDEDCGFTIHSEYAHKFEIGLNDLFYKRSINLSFINGTITPNLDTISKKTLETAIKIKDHAAQHFKNAITALSMGESINADQCMRESICAVEYTVNQKLQTNTLGNGIKKLRNDDTIHKALLDSLDKLYGYTSDTARHSIKNTQPTPEEAKLTLSLCSAWAEYLRTILPDRPAS